jgi:hypothetical protein
MKVAALSALLMVTNAAVADSTAVLEEDPSAGAMTADLLLVRPLLLVATVVGGAVWLVSSPFSAAGGNAQTAADTLVVGPAKNTFVRCLGCVGEGYKTHRDTE